MSRKTAVSAGLAGTGIMLVLLQASCVPALRSNSQRERLAATAPGGLPAAYADATIDSSASAAAMPPAASRSWQSFFNDPDLSRLIDSALAGNQELNILLQEIEIARNDAKARRGEYLPSVRVSAGAGAEKAARYTRNGAVEHAIEIEPEKENPEPLRDFRAVADVSWEVDIWNRLRNGSRAATLRYLATTEGRNFAVTHLVAEVARTYYELAALDRRRALIEETIAILDRAREVVRLQKAAGRANELAVRRFDAELLKNRGRLAETRQMVTATQNRLNQLIGRYPEEIVRNGAVFDSVSLPVVMPGSPDGLLRSRPDVRQAELQLTAAKLDVRAARARFFPTLGLNGSLGLQSFELGKLVSTPASTLYGIAADMTMPLLNRRAIAAEYRSAEARQLQSLYEYQRTLVAAYTEVSTQLSRIRNLDSSYVAKASQVDALRQSIALADQLFRSARADYLEVLLTQRESLESRIELVELRQQQLDARVTAYQALGGGALSTPDAGGR